MPPIFAILSILSITMYIFYKVKFFRSRLPVERQWISAKSRIALALFILFYGLNQLLLWDTSAATIIGTVFIIFGLFSAVMGYRAFRYFSPLVKEEAKQKETKLNSQS